MHKKRCRWEAIVCNALCCMRTFCFGEESEREMEEDLERSIDKE